MKKQIYYLGLLLAVSIWGSLYVASKFVLAEIPAFLLVFLRFAIASIVLLFTLKSQNPPKIEKSDYPLIFCIGFMGYFIANSALLLGIQFSNASVSSLINSLNPILIIIFAGILLKERLTVQKIIAVLCAVVGAAIIIGTSAGSNMILGIIFSAISMITWSLVVIAIRKTAQKYSSLIITTYGMCIASVCSLPAAIIAVLTSNKKIVISGSLVLGVLYIGIICTALSHVLWNKCLSKVEAGNCAVFYPVQPMVSVLFGCLLLGETITLQFIIGSVFIIGGVLCSLIRRT